MTAASRAGKNISSTPTAPGNDPDGGRFVLRAGVLDADDLRRAHTRIAHEIVERNHGAERPRARRPLHPRSSRSPAASPTAIERVRARRRCRSARSTSPSTATTSAPRGAAARPHRGPGRRRGQGRRARRRRAVHRPHGARRARRAHRARPSAGGAARGPRRPRSPGAADPRRLRGQEPADQRHGEDVRVRLEETDDEPDGVELWGEPRAGDELESIPEGA